MKKIARNAANTLARQVAGTFIQVRLDKATKAAKDAEKVKLLTLAGAVHAASYGTYMGASISTTSFQNSEVGLWAANNAPPGGWGDKISRPALAFVAAHPLKYPAHAARDLLRAEQRATH